MSTLYVFGIGGTGVRVLRSLTMLLASGVKCDMDIAPIIIDPHTSGTALTRTIGALDDYKRVYDKLQAPDTFFGTKIKEVVKRYCIDVKTNNKSFDEHISRTKMSNENEALIRLIFSDENLAALMEVGFRGNPNIGSVILSKIFSTPEFKEFTNNFQEGDRILIISSIFGGTGSSGFPLLLKTLRTNRTLPNYNLLNNSLIGGITVLPYFSLNMGSINSSGFIDRTKAALRYYSSHISDGTIDRLYYISDRKTATYDNQEKTQENQAHIVELISALAVLDFADPNIIRKSETVTNENGDKLIYYKTECFEYGIKKDPRHQDEMDSDSGPDPVTFLHLGEKTKNTIKNPLTQFLFFKKYMDNACKQQYKHQPWAIDAGFDDNFFSETEFANDVKIMLGQYEQWLIELGGNTRGFAPFDLSEDKKSHPFNMVKGPSPRKTKYDNYALFDDALNVQIRPAGTSTNQWFVDLFYNATKQLIQQKNI